VIAAISVPMVRKAAKLLSDPTVTNGDGLSRFVGRQRRLKNRYIAPKTEEINPAITLAAMLAPYNDTGRWSLLDAVPLYPQLMSTVAAPLLSKLPDRCDPEHGNSGVRLLRRLSGTPAVGVISLRVIVVTAR
jgi:hypothetical protein